MKVPAKLRFCFLLALAFLAAFHARAQFVTVGVSNSPGPVSIGGTITYTISITNKAATGQIVVTDIFPASVQFVSAGNITVGSFITNSASNVVFQFTSLVIGEAAVMDVNVSPTAPGLITNLVAVGELGVTNVAFATNVSFVSGAGVSVGLSIAGPTNAVLANDWTTYTVTVTNPGSFGADGVTLTNFLPPGFALLSVSPTNGEAGVTNGAVSFNLGTLAAGMAETISFLVQPSNSGTFTLDAAAASFRSTNATTATNSLTVLPFDTTQLVASNFSAMTYDPQNALMEQTVQVSNIGTNNIAAARVIVSGLTNVLFNAVGTNNGSPFVQYTAPTNAPLAPGQNVNLLLQYFVPTRLPIVVANSNYAAVPVPAPDLQPPSGTPFMITLVTNLPDGRLLIEFPATPGLTYTVLYSDNPAMSNSLAAEPSIVAQANRVQWIDSGPPGTISAPTNVASRFYSVLQNQ
jgi:uncharacterized repeat protein (TIGR01451 family)